jgi:hypothetical protein
MGYDDAERKAKRDAECDFRGPGLTKPAITETFVTSSG